MQRTQLVIAVLVVLVGVHLAGWCDTPAGQKLPDSELLWYDLMSLDIEGRAWTETESFYDRLPAKAKEMIPKAVWNLSLQSAGMNARFVTDAQEIAVAWELRSARLAMSHMAATGVSGIDLYCRYEDTWRWLGTGRPEKYPSNRYTVAKELDPGEREYRVYLPLYNGVNEVLIGVPEGAVFRKAAPYPAEIAKPIVFYGTSIMQGGCASRPGMAFSSILGRRLDRPIVNLGFSGNGKMQPGMESLIAELDAAVFFIDCLPNMGGADVEKRAEIFVRALREAHPETPIILAEDRTYGYAYLKPKTRETQEQRRDALRAVYDKLVGEGMAGLHPVPGEGQVGDDAEGMVDGSHPTDLGMMRMADFYEPYLRKALGE